MARHSRVVDATRVDKEPMAKRNAIFLALLAVLGAAQPVAAEPWHGIWTAEPDWCRNAEYVGSRTPAPIQMTAEFVAGYENTCRVLDVRQVGTMQAWHLVLEGQSEGSVYDDATVVMLGDEGTMWRWFGAGDPVRFTRCP